MLQLTVWGWLEEKNASWCTASEFCFLSSHVFVFVCTRWYSCLSLHGSPRLVPVLSRLPLSYCKHTMHLDFLRWNYNIEYFHCSHAATTLHRSWVTEISIWNFCISQAVAAVLFVPQGALKKPQKKMRKKYRKRLLKSTAAKETSAGLSELDEISHIKRRTKNGTEDFSWWKNIEKNTPDWLLKEFSSTHISCSPSHQYQASQLAIKKDLIAVFKIWKAFPLWDVSLGSLPNGHLKPMDSRNVSSMAPG